MTQKVNDFARPVVWGVFICLILEGLTFVVRTVRVQHLETEWQQDSTAAEGRIQKAVIEAFRGKVQELMVFSARVGRDSVFFEELREREEGSAIQAFARLERRRPTEDFTVDVVDPRGNIVAWAGRSITPDYSDFMPPSTADSFTVILQSGLHTYLSAGIATSRRDFFVVASHPLEIQYPISNRFVKRVSFSEDLTKTLTTEVWLALNTTSQVHAHKKTRYVQLKDFGNKTIGYVFYVPETLSSQLQLVESQFSYWTKNILALTVFLTGILLFQLRKRVGKIWLHPVAGTVVIWLIRIVWRSLDFPSSAVGGPLFDSTLYASMFPMGLTGSIGELFLTVSALCLNIIMVWSSLESRDERRGPGSTVWMTRTVRYVVVFTLMLLFLWGLRGYAEALRTFVFDSTLLYHDPAVTIPTLPVIMMHVNMMLLTVSLLCAFVILLRFVENLMRQHAKEMRPWWAVPSAIFLFSLAFFVWISQPLAFPLYFPVFVFVVGVLLAQWISAKRAGSDGGRPLLWKTLPVLILCSFILSVPMLDTKLHDKERQQVRLFAENLLRPVDGWLSFVLADGLRTVADKFEALSFEPMSNRNTTLAFALWAQTLMSREGYNSGVVVYDKDGREFSRFTVGMGTYEQRELLTKLFDSEEEVVQVVDRVLSGSSVKFYGVWSILRNEHNEIMGSAALMLSASQRSLFRGETPEALRSFVSPTFESMIRQVSISEFRDGILVSSSLNDWYRGMPLPESVRKEMRGDGQKEIWTREQINSKEFENLYVADQRDFGKIIVISLGTLDLRWHLFNLVKVFLVYALFLLLVNALRWFVFWGKGSSPIRGFEGKLASAFGFLGLIPLLLLGYYNRQVASERVQENVQRTLLSDLTLVEQRILGVISDEEDFLRGVNDAFCENVAPELAVDFTVFRRSLLQATSRPELYQAAIMDSRLPGNVYANVVLLGRNFYVETETVGEVEYAVGYKPLYVSDRLVGVLAVPALYRQKEIDEELAQRNAFVFGAYALAFGLVLLISIGFARRLARPIRDLTNAASQVGSGNLDVRLDPVSSDEVGNLTKTFNEMVQELKSSRNELTRVERELAWKEMAKQVAHEIKNPLTPMKLSIQHLRQAFKDKARNREDILKEVTKTVIDQIDALSRIATEFSHFAQMPQRRFERVDVQKLLSESVALFKEVRGIEFRVNFSDTKIDIVADAEELRRVFINLIRNSVQAIKRTGTISVESRQTDRRCIIRLSDTGAGIAPEIRSKVFEPNFSTKSEGMGLGLAISQKTIQDLGGSITFVSEVGKGTTFEIVLPV